jgi:hypothetical protein
MPEGNFVKKTEEQIELEADMEAYRSKRWWTQQFMIAGLVFYGLGLLTIWTETVWIYFMAAGLLFWMVHLVLDIRDKTKARKIQKKVDAYNRKKNVPLYHELLDKMGDKYHLHLADDGTIIIRDTKNVSAPKKHDDKQKPEDA